MINFYKYHLPFKKPFKTGSDEFNSRSGILIHYSNQQNESLVEASPLPGFSEETIAQVKQVLIAQKNHIERFFNSDFSESGLQRFLHSMPHIPSLQFALSYLGIDLLIQRRKTTLNKLFGISPNTVIKINKVIGNDSPEQILKSIEKGVNDGFTTFKIKASGPIYKLTAALKKAAVQFPHIIFRIDANRSWPDTELESILTALKELPIEYIEEPTPFRNLHEVNAIIQNSTIPIALDESLIDSEFFTSVLRDLPNAVLIIKPGLLGSFFNFFETINRYRTLFNDVVITTSLESAVGRKMVLTVASVLGDPNKAHGLNTGHLFEYDLHPGFIVKKGLISIPANEALSLSISEINSDLTELIT